jgi:hypothetical protein
MQQEHKNKRRAREVELEVTYGVGGTCASRFSRESVLGLTARQLIARVAHSPQPEGPAARTAAVLAEAIKTSRKIDAELAKARRGRTSSAVPIALDDVVVPVRADGESNDSQEQVTEETLSILVSESYQGGMAGVWDLEACVQRTS